MNLQIKNNLIKNSSYFFEKNSGQQYGDAKFMLQKGNLKFFFLKDRITIGIIESLSEDENKKLKEFLKKSKKQPKEKLPQRKINFMDILFENSNIDVDIIGENEQKSKSNYFGHNLPEEGITNINTYSKIKYKNIYPNIDLVFYFNENLLEYDFIVKPTGNPSDIKLSFNGNDSLNLDKQGNAIISFKDLNLKLLKPISYQMINKTKAQVKSNFAINESKLNIEVETYDKSKELIIDPILFYSTYLGGNFATLSYNIAVDSTGNAYVTGYTNSSDFYTTNPIIGVAYNTSYAVFVTKYDTNGNLIYSTYINGNNDDISVSIAVDLSNNVYITGYTYSIDYPIVPNVPDTPNIHGFPPDGFNSGIFITKLNELGNTILYSAYIHGESLDYVSSIAIDYNNSPYITGFTYSKDYPSTNDLGSKPIIGGTAVFVTKFKPNGYDIDYSTCIYSATNDLPPNPEFAYSYAYSIAVDSIGSAYITGSTYSANYPIVPNTNTHGSVVPTNGDTAVFVTKLDPPGQNIVYSAYINGNDSDESYAIAVDSSNSAYITGVTYSADTYPIVPPTNVHGVAPDSRAAVFVTKFDPIGENIVYSAYIHGTSDFISYNFGEISYGIALDASNNAYITGATTSTNYPTTDIFGVNPNESVATFVTELDPSGDAILFSAYINGTNDDYGFGIALDKSKNIYATGITDSSDFPTERADDSTLSGDTNSFVLKFITPENLLENVYDELTDPDYGLEQIKNELDDVNDAIFDPDYGLQAINDKIENLDDTASATLQAVYEIKRELLKTNKRFDGLEKEICCINSKLNHILDLLRNN